MAILDITKQTSQLQQDRDKSVFVGIDLPFHRSDGVEGYFKSTDTTLKAVKNNIKNLLLTNPGERLMRPTFGNPYRESLFEQMDPELQVNLMKKMTNIIKAWLPFVNVTKFEIAEGANNGGDVDMNSIKIKIEFTIRNVSSLLETVEIDLSTASSY